MSNVIYCLADFGSSLPSYLDAAKQMTSSGLSPLGDLLGLFESPQPPAASEAQPATVVAAAASAATQPSSDDSIVPSKGAPPSSSSAGKQFSAQLRLDDSSYGGADRAAAIAALDSTLIDLPEEVIGPPAMAPLGSQRTGGIRGTSPRLSLNRRSSGLASSSSWGPFASSEEAETQVPIALPHARPAVAASALSSDTAEEPLASGKGSSITSEEERRRLGAGTPDRLDVVWSSPHKQAQQHLPPSPFQQRAAPPSNAIIQNPSSEGGATQQDTLQASSNAGGRVHKLGSRDNAAAQSISSQQSGHQHWPIGADVDSLLSWSSFTTPEQAEQNAHAAPPSQDDRTDSSKRAAQGSQTVL